MPSRFQFPQAPSQSLSQRATSLGLALLLTFGVLASIDRLAAREAAAPAWACAVGNERA